MYKKNKSISEIAKTLMLGKTSNIIVVFSVNIPCLKEKVGTAFSTTNLVPHSPKVSHDLRPTGRGCHHLPYA